MKKFALLGGPNSGKTTLFNSLTGLRRKTGNYPGVTVEKNSGLLDCKQETIELVDLPGTYSLNPISEDEKLAVEYVSNKNNDLDGIVFVADSTCLEKSLPFLINLLKLNKPIMLVCTMIDEHKARGGELDFFKLKQLLGLPIVGVVGNKGLGVQELKNYLVSSENWKKSTLKIKEETNSANLFQLSEELVSQATKQKIGPNKLTQRLDNVLLHPIWGLIIFFIFMTIFFQSIFTLAGPLMDYFSGALEGLAENVKTNMPPSVFTNLLADGIILGVGAVVVFLPQIAILFTLIFFLESSGYMARAAFLMDRIMGSVGLEGRSFISLLSSYACAIPGIMATRSIPSSKNRLATILVAPLTTCAARLPVYAILIATFIPEKEVFGPLTLQGLTLMGLYLLGALSALIFAAIFKKTLLAGSSLPFFLELPPYRKPSIKAMGVQVWEKLKTFLQKAGSAILIGSIVLWFLLNFPEKEFNKNLSDIENKRLQIEQSYASDIGKSLSPIFDPLGFDWKINIGLIGSFAARELMVSTMAQVYGAEEDDENMFSEIGLPAAISLLIFFVYALLCVSTIATVKKETNSWRWPLFMFSYLFAAAWLTSFAAFQIISSGIAI